MSEIGQTRVLGWVRYLLQCLLCPVCDQRSRGSATCRNGPTIDFGRLSKSPWSN